MGPIRDLQFEGALELTRQTGGKSGQDPTDSLKKATDEFEAMFLSYLLKVMRSTVETPDTEGSSIGKDIYIDLFDNEIAMNIAQNRGLGIGEMMYRQLKAREGTSVSQENTPDDQTSIPAGTTPTTAKSPEEPVSGKSEVLSTVSLPVDGSVSSQYGLRRDPFTGAQRFHKGIDIAAPSGTAFYAASSGTVVFAGLLSTYGNTAIIENSNGDRSLYAHAAHLVVRAGDAVDKGQVIGLVGSTGRSTGSHLHFEVEVMGKPVDPRVLHTSADAKMSQDLKISSKVAVHSHDK